METNIALEFNISFKMKGPKVTVRKIVHRGHTRLGLFFKYSNDAPAQRVKNIIKSIPNRRYSYTLKCWHIPNTPQSIMELNRLKNILSFYTEYQKKNKEVVLTEFDDETLIQLQSFENYLKQKRYAERTIQSYLQVLKVFTNWLNNKKEDGISESAIQAFNLEYFIRGKYSRSYQNIFVNAIKLYLQKIEKSPTPSIQVERPRRSNNLPNVLSEDEIKKLIRSYSNLKHRSIILCYYACGLRKSELINLKLSDLDWDRKILRVRNSKGAKDRDISLPMPLENLLKKYILRFSPKQYLFNGKGNIQYSARSIDNLLSQGLRRAQINKKITVHGLRHSYATHLVEKNINLRFIQEALGHKSSKTTEIYTKLSKENIAKLVSPIDFWEDDTPS